MKIENEGEGQKGKKERYRNEEEAGIETEKHERSSLLCLPVERILGEVRIWMPSLHFQKRLHVLIHKLPDLVLLLLLALALASASNGPPLLSSRVISRRTPAVVAVRFSFLLFYNSKY